MFPNSVVCESLVAQYRQDRLQEAAAERSLRAMRHEQREAQGQKAQRSQAVATLHVSKMRRVWRAIGDTVSVLLW
jgi:hypothetical protein